MAEQLATRYGIAATYTDVRALLEREKPDVVHITTPPLSHVPIAHVAIDAGCHVYVEKPLAPRHQDALELLERARRAQRQLTVGYTYMFDPPAIAMRELYQRGALGDPVHIESIYGYDLGGPFGRALAADRGHWVRRLPGKLLHNTIDHLLNKLVEFVDSDEPEVLAIGRQLASGAEPMLDELRVLIAGERVTAHATFSAHARPVLHQCRVFGTKGTALIDYVSRTVTLEQAPLPSALGRVVAPLLKASQLVRAAGTNALRFAKSEDQFFAGMRELIRRFYESIRSGGPAPISSRDIAWVSAVMARVLEQVGPRSRLFLEPRAGVA
jgi:predicted dehydrogenase